MPISDGRRDHERRFVVKRLLIRSSVFVRTAKHLVKKQPHIKRDTHVEGRRTQNGN